MRSWVEGQDLVYEDVTLATEILQSDLQTGSLGSIVTLSIVSRSAVDDKRVEIQKRMGYEAVCLKSNQDKAQPLDAGTYI